MKNKNFNLLISFFSVLLFCSVVNVSKAQTIRGGCDKIIVESVPNYPNNYYISDGVYGYVDPCTSILLVGWPESIKYVLQKYNYSTNQWNDFLTEKSANTSEFIDLETGRYRIEMYLPKKLYKPQCVDDAMAIIDNTGKFLGWLSAYNNTPDIVTNEVWVGEAEISSSDAWFDNYGFNPSAFDFGQTVRVNLKDMPKYSRWKGVIRDEQTLEEYETAWKNVDVDVGPFFVSQVWQGDPFEPFHTYKATIWVTNHECQEWKPLDMPFFICPAGTGCRLQSQEVSVDFYPNPASGYIVLKGLDHLHLEDQIEIKVFDNTGKLVMSVSNPSQREIGLGKLTSGIYFVSILLNQENIETKKLIVE